MFTEKLVNNFLKKQELIISEINLAIENFKKNKVLKYELDIDEFKLDRRSLRSFLNQLKKDVPNSVSAVYWWYTPEGKILNQSLALKYDQIKKKIKSKHGAMMPLRRKSGFSERMVYIGSKAKSKTTYLSNRIEQHIGINLASSKVFKNTSIKFNEWYTGKVILVVLPLGETGKFGANFIEEELKNKTQTFIGRREN
jgi:hypothetical protein